jgi:osmotically-inducible protein OsmY
MRSKSWMQGIVVFCAIGLLATEADAARMAAYPGAAAQSSGVTNGNVAAPADHGRYDAQILQEVTAELQKRDWAGDVRVSVDDGMVTLQGRVPLYVDKVSAYDKIHNKPHVRGVRDEISVAGPNVPDPDLASKLADKLRYDRAGYGSTFNNFQIGVKNGVVTLAGAVRNPVDAQSALALVASTPGVKDVIDDVNVLPASGFDDEIRLSVARAVYGNPVLQKYSLDPQRPIRIVVDNGHVTLWGVVDSQVDKQVAEQAANSVPNVFSVKDNLVVANQK